MKKKIGLIFIGIIIFVIILFASYFIYLSNLKSKVSVRTESLNSDNDTVSKTKDLDNVAYRDFTIYKDDGTEVYLSEFSDKPCMLLFFDENDKDSMTVLDRVESIYKNYENKVNFFMISTSQDVNEDLKNKYSIEIFYDFYKEAMRNYIVTEFPSMIFIRENNEVFNPKSGLITTDALEANLEIIADNI